MIQLEKTGVQRLARKLLQRLYERLTGRRRYAETTAIERIAHQRITEMGHVHTNLMGAPGFQLDPHMGMRAEAFQHPVMGDRRLATFDHGHALTLLAMTTNRRIDSAAGDDHADDDGFINTADATRLQLLDQTRLGLQCL